MKQEQKNKILASTFIGLTLLVGALLFANTRNGSVDKEAFAIPDLDLVDSLQLKSSLSTIILSFDEARWNVNGKYKADDQMITVLFATLQQAVPKRVVSQNLIEEVNRKLDEEGIEVTLYRDRDMIRKMIVGGNEMKSETYFKDDLHDPHVMNIPGYRVYVSGIFELDESGWRDKRIFDFNWRNFKKLVTKFTDPTKSGFEVEDAGQGFVVKGLSKTDTTRLNNYLDDVSLLVARNIYGEGQYPGTDTLSENRIIATIEVFDLGENVHSLQIYRQVAGADHFIGKTTSGEIAFFDQSQVMPLLRPREYFAVKEP